MITMPQRPRGPAFGQSSEDTEFPNTVPYINEEVTSTRYDASSSNMNFDFGSIGFGSSDNENKYVIHELNIESYITLVLFRIDFENS